MVTWSVLLLLIPACSAPLLLLLLPACSVLLLLLPLPLARTWVHLVAGEVKGGLQMPAMRGILAACICCERLQRDSERKS